MPGRLWTDSLRIRAVYIPWRLHMYSTRSRLSVSCSTLLVILPSLLLTTLAHMPDGSSPPWRCSKAGCDSHVNCKNRPSEDSTSIIILNDIIWFSYVSRRASQLYCALWCRCSWRRQLLYEKNCDGLCNMWTGVTECRVLSQFPSSPFFCKQLLFSCAPSLMVFMKIAHD